MTTMSVRWGVFEITTGRLAQRLDHWPETEEWVRKRVDVLNSVWGSNGRIYEARRLPSHAAAALLLSANRLELCLIKPTDLRAITRRSNSCLTVVKIQMNSRTHV